MKPIDPESFQQCTDRFNSLNKFVLQTGHIRCEHCKRWLRNIHSDTGGRNLCETCAKESDTFPNLALQQILENAKYPCDACGFSGPLEDLDGHNLKCHHKITCPECKHLLESTEIIQHFQVVHSNISRSKTTKKMVVDIALTSKELELFIVTLEVSEDVKHTFVVIIHKEGDIYSITVGTESLQSLANNHFHALYGKGACQLSIQGQIKSIEEAFNDDNLKDTEFYLKDTDTVKFKVYFGDYHRAADISECCINRMACKDDACRNGNGCCKRCKKSIKDCQTCSNKEQDITSIKHLLANYYFKCPKSDAGCLYIAKPQDIDNHLKTCLFDQVHCDGCLKNVIKLNLRKHYNEEHQPSECPITQKFPIDAADSHTFYFAYEKAIFGLKFESKINSNDKDMHLKINFKVSLITSEEGEQAYRCKVELLGVDQNSFLSFDNVCTPNAKEVESNFEINSINSNLICSPNENEYNIQFKTMISKYEEK